MSLALTSKIATLKDRAAMLKKARAFFDEREIIEVDVPILSQLASVDVHIDLISTTVCGKQGYLHSSPEYGMKRLLALGMGDCFQLSHVFRNEEIGERHQPEFLMAEWYRHTLSFKEMIEETFAFIKLFLPVDTYKIFRYREIFMQYLGRFPETVEERDYLFALDIEPQLGKESITVITHFPPEQAALSELSDEGLALRFECFYQGVELANGYQELVDGQEQKHRLQKANNQRVSLGKEPYPIDEHFLAALERGIEPCCGVAVGVDRLMMLRHEVEDIREVIPFSWEEA